MQTLYCIKDKETGNHINHYGLPSKECWMDDKFLKFATKETAQHHIDIDKLYNVEITPVTFFENEQSPLPKFKNAGALAAAYLELEKEFSRKSQLLKQKSLKYASLEITQIEFYDDTLLISWQCNLGFGQCELFYDQRTKEWTANSECMSEEFVNALIRKMFEKVKVI